MLLGHIRWGNCARFGSLDPSMHERVDDQNDFLSSQSVNYSKLLLVDDYSLLFILGRYDTWN